MDPASFWDEAYRIDHYRYGTRPNAFLAEVAPTALARPSRVLVVGDGEGRNGVWLAAQGHDVVTVDASAEGPRKARALAVKHGVTPDIRQGLFPAAVAGEAPFDAVVLIYVHVPPDRRPGFHRAAVDALAPGGVVILEGFRPEQRTLGRTSGGPPDTSMLFTEDALRADFAGLTVERLESATVTLDEGPGHAGVAEVVRLVVRTA